jgi:hypothetical protein
MIEYITANYENFLAVIGAVVTLASTIVVLTPSTKDDEILGKVVEFISRFSVFNRKVK